MTVCLAFDASITAAAGVVGFDLKFTTDPPATWSPGAGATLEATRLEVPIRRPRRRPAPVRRSPKGTCGWI
jgi:hypothetical protein